MSIITLNTRSLPDSAVTTAKIAADAVTDAKIADDVVGTEHLTAGEVDATALGADSVTAAKINNDIISGSTELASEPADTDEFLVSDAGTLKRIDYSLIKGGGSWVLVNTQTVSSGTPSSVESGAVFSSTYDTYVIVIRRFNIDSTGGLLFYIGDSSSYTTSGYRWNISGVGDGGSSLINGEANANEISLLGETNSTYHVNSTQDCLSAVLWIHNPYNSNRTSIHGELAWENANDVKVHIANIGAHPGTDKSYDRWKIAPSTGNFEATTIVQTFGVVNA